MKKLITKEIVFRIVVFFFNFNHEINCIMVISNHLIYGCLCFVGKTYQWLTVKNFYNHVFIHDAETLKSYFNNIFQFVSSSVVLKIWFHNSSHILTNELLLRINILFLIWFILILKMTLLHFLVNTCIIIKA